jgi:starvation-inducible DNA-binding protein
MGKKAGAAMHSQPWLHQHGKEIQQYGTVRQLPLGLSHDARMYSCQRLNQLLADSQILFALYKKHHWLMRGATFYQLHLLLDKHAGEQIELIDQLAERVQTLGGIAVGDPRHVAEITRVPRPPNGCEEVPAMLSRLLEAHEMILIDAHEAAARTAEQGDDGTNDLIVSDLIRLNELQSWFLVVRGGAMTVAVIGVTGRVGSRLAAELLARGHQVTGIVRDRSKAGAIAGITLLEGNATKPAELAPLLAGHDAVMSASRFQTADAAALVSAVKQAGVKRLIVVGGAGSLEVAPGKALMDTPGFPEAFKAETGGAPSSSSHCAGKKPGLDISCFFRPRPSSPLACAPANSVWEVTRS